MMWWKEAYTCDGFEIESYPFPSLPASICCVIMSKLLNPSDPHVISL